jgi:PAS domain S-box-containing protein
MGILKFLKFTGPKVQHQAMPQEPAPVPIKPDEPGLYDPAGDLIQQLRQAIDNQREELLATQAQLVKLQDQYGALYDFAPIGYCTIDRNCRIWDANLTISKQLGVDKKLLLDTRFDDYVVQYDQDKFLAYLKRIFDKKPSQICEVKLRSHQERPFFAQLDSMIVQNNGAGIPLCRLAITDITELNQAKNALMRRDSELALLNRVSHAFNSALESDQIIVTVLKEVRRLLEATACSIWLLDQSTNELVCQYAIGPHGDTVRGWRITTGQGIVGWVAKTGKSLLVPDARTDDRHFNGVDRKTGYPLRSIISVPLHIKHEVIGVLEVLDTEVNRFNATDQALQELLAALASLAIKNVRLTEQVRQDEQTKDLLVREITYRDTHTLATIVSLLSTVRRHAGVDKDSLCHVLMSDLILRIRGLKTVHDLLAEFEWHPVPVNELCQRMLTYSLTSLSSDKQITVDIAPSPIRIAPERANSLGFVIHELVTNTLKHGMIDRNTGKITIHIARVGDTTQFEFRDDGPGYPADVQKFERYNLGLYLIEKIVRKDLEGKLILDNDPGAVTIIRFKNA